MKLIKFAKKRKNFSYFTVKIKKLEKYKHIIIN